MTRTSFLNLTSSRCMHGLLCTFTVGRHHAHILRVIDNEEV